DERSKTGIFKDIFLDIGDEQSIENDLSTYSSHLLNMKFMLKQAGPESLILIDEFGGGTEPNIGGAIAEALLHRFNEKGCFGIITTHYHNLKLYADSHEGVVNGAMLYDRHLMQPLFQLSIGQPGSSFAIEIARKIGLSEDVIAEASEKVGQDYIRMDKYLQDIVRDKRYWESKRQQIRRQEKNMEELSERYRSDLEKLESQKKEWLAKAKTDAEQLLSEANVRIEKTIREIKEAQAEKGKTKEIRKELETFRQKVKNEEVKGEKVKSEKAKREKAAAAFAVGDTVRMKGQHTAGTVMIAKDDFFIVAFGAIKTIVKAGQIEKTAAPKPTAGYTPPVLMPSTASALSQKKLDFKLEIDVRGMRGDEALQTVIYYLDDAIQCNAGRVRILHGTGTGVLRQIIREYLQTALGVKHFRDEHVQFGGAGITVVELE
ncbi:MAG: Smr/MutS family protein, partial [Dysgonamonadaceae bacterium]|nr:Smr/MutS family protein [Dysgonamonadaceae bacterium]